MSLLLILAVCALWVRSHRVGGSIVYTTLEPDAEGLHWNYGIISAHGRATMSRVALPGHVPSPRRLSVATGRPDEFQYDVADDSRAPLRYRLGFYGYWRTTSAGYTGRGWEVRFPYWLVLILTSLLPLAESARIYRRRSPQAAGLCPRCGYDLRASPERCPECGTAHLARISN